MKDPIEKAMTDCDKYDHVPENYEIAFWRCATCKKELIWVTPEALTASYERGKIDQLADIARGNGFPNLAEAVQVANRHAPDNTPEV